MPDPTHLTLPPQIGSNILRQMADMYRKVRGTLRFLLGNLADYDPRAHAVPYGQLPALDRFLLYRTAQINKELAAAYDTYQVRGRGALRLACPCRTTRL